MARKSAFDRLADLAGQIDALNKKADALASQLFSAKTAARSSNISKRGIIAERKLRELEREFSKVERSMLRPTRRETAKRKARLERERDERSILDQLRIGQRFMVQATYRRKNHNLFVDVIITYIGLPLDERSDKAKITQAVIDLANGQAPLGFGVELVAYDSDKGVQRFDVHDGKTDRTKRGKGELDKVAAALASNKTHWTVGELDK